MRIVRDGYQRVAEAYTASRSALTADVRLLDEFIALLPARARVLDAGCGGGAPISRLVAEHAQVTGVDLAGAQIELARQNVPEGEFMVGNLTDLELPDESFDGVVSYYAIIHIPRDLHTRVLVGLYRVLKPGGVALLCLGANDLPEDVDDFQGVEMYWSHFDAATSERMVAAAGFSVIWARRVVDESAPSPDDGECGDHLFVLARKPAPPTGVSPPRSEVTS